MDRSTLMIRGTRLAWTRSGWAAAPFALVALLLAGLMGAPPTSTAQAIQVADINPGSAGSFPSAFQVYDGALYFQAEDGTSGAELWTYDGSTIAQVADIASGSFDADPRYPALYDGKLYFQASDAALSVGRELWVYTSATDAVANAVDINAGPSSSSPKYLTVYDGLLHFSAFTLNRGTELWSSDGASASRLTDLNDGAANADPAYLAVYDNALYFSAGDGTNGRELWAYDGTDATLAANIHTGASSSPQHLIVYDGALYFAANGDAHGRELWRYDGTDATLVTDLTPGSGSSFPSYMSDAPESAFAIYGGKLYFPASTPSTGTELFVYDGTAVTLAADLASGSGGSQPQYLTVYNDRLYFSADGNASGGRELWVYDGSAATLAAEVDPSAIGSDPAHLTVYAGRLLFQADDGTDGPELWAFEDTTPIPVELTSFEAALDGRDVHLTWRTASETNNAGFAIERARGDGAFQRVGFVAGEGTTTRPQTYDFTDRLPGAHVPRYRYRLKQVDLDGSFSYSPEVEVVRPVSGGITLALAGPNPFAGETALRMAAARSATLRLVLYNALGQAVRVLFDGAVPAGRVQTIPVRGGGLPSGVYFARLTGAGEPVVQQVVVMR